MNALLSDLAFFHEYQNILDTVIKHYLIACEKQENLEVFADLIMDFYYAVSSDGYDVFQVMKEKYHPGTDKRKVIDFLDDIEDTGVDEDDLEM